MNKYLATVRVKGQTVRTTQVAELAFALRIGLAMRSQEPVYMHGEKIVLLFFCGTEISGRGDPL